MGDIIRPMPHVYILANFFGLGNRNMTEIERKEVQYQEILQNSAGQRLDNYLVKELKGVPKSHIYRIIRSGEVRINMQRCKPSVNLKMHDIVRIPPIRVSKNKEVIVSHNFAETLLESIIYEDDKFLVVNKPAGMAVHGGSGVSFGVIEALRKLRSELPYLELVHRLDKETSGCLIIAKKRSMLRALHVELEARRVRKTYLTLLDNAWQGAKQQVVDVSLQKNILKSGERMVTVNKLGKPSHTTFQLLENYHKACMVKVTPKTGRTHQIRVHSAYLGHPIIGDKKYANADSQDRADLKTRLCLHASEISFTLDGKKYKFAAEIDTAFATTRSIISHEKAI